MRAFASRSALLVASSLFTAACGSSGSEGTTDPDPARDAGSEADGSADAAAPDARPVVGIGIEHVLVISQENHTFDTYFGSWCTATPGSNPTCTAGPACCEAAPAKEPSGSSPVSLTDAANAAFDPNHSKSCEVAEINGGAMDRFVTGGGTGCSDRRNFAVSPADTVATYRALAQSGALADRYFQSVAGQTSANDMFFAVAKSVFIDNSARPASIGAGCNASLGSPVTYTGQTTIADLVIGAGKTFAFYAEGYQAMKSAAVCPLPPLDCPFHLPNYPCNYDPSDVPFQYYAQFKDNPTYMKDFGDFATDIAAGNLASLTFVKGLGYHTEHPGYGTRISDGQAFVRKVVDAVAASPVASKTLVLITWDEGGGYFDHVAPPPTNPVDNEPYGTRVPLIALGPFARKGYISHVTMEHSSFVRFVERAFTGTTGQLRARDANVNDIGSLLDPTMTSLATP